MFSRHFIWCGVSQTDVINTSRISRTSGGTVSRSKKTTKSEASCDEIADPWVNFSDVHNKSDDELLRSKRDQPNALFRSRNSTISSEISQRKLSIDNVSTSVVYKKPVQTTAAASRNRGDTKEIDDISCQETKKPAQCSGYMTKQGEVFRSWKSRFFVLNNGVIMYYTGEPSCSSEGEGQIGSSLVLRGYKVTSPEQNTLYISIPGRRGTLSAVATEEQSAPSMLVKVKTNEEFLIWEKALKEHITYINSTKY